MLEPPVDQQRAPSSGYQVPIQQLPSAGFRIPLQGTSHSGLPPEYLAGQPIVNWATTPIYFGSAIFDKSVHPCKIEYNRPNLPAPCSVAVDNAIIFHEGRYDLLQFNPDTMEFVRASEGRIPAGRRPVKGGYEEDGMPLYHGIAMHPNKHRVPGKTSPRLRGCVYSYSNDVHLVTDYEILCWK
ncbi:uncharacterized protein EV420DRAFT_1585085 [Desarmillaria tabescens]|uniref:Uncharacterized protein n=1 Tax=Armillaria tabescens TaxID=1929756 RepID=A0AA39JCM6_ARMTA|nr:uncharacterized protein EV420DRAFT_1585085 [Desarmillaria tabescens]KAK0438879.1 hypothetical protein EV420DRAFT_1585085 [Desarmillaria tabescens]